MKILYYSDNYTWDNYGTKRSIYLELKKRPGFKVKWVDRSEVGNIVKKATSYKADQIWLSHSALTIPQEHKNALNKEGMKIIGIGMSDPYYFKTDRLDSYNAYITNHIGTYETYKSAIPCHYNRTACDFQFHKYERSIQRDVPVSIIGTAEHPRFENKMERFDIVVLLRNKGVKVAAYGTGWPEHQDNHGHVEGKKFRKIIQRTMLGLDIQDKDSPLAHRMFEYSGCAVPVITRRRDEVFSCFEENSEILMYDSHEELLDKVSYYISRPAELEKIGLKAYERCKKEHDIKNRIDDMIPFINSL